MDFNKTTLERAFELAKSGRCTGIPDLVTRLKAEGYSRSQIEGRGLRQQLLELIRRSHRDSVSGNSS
jgi:LmbE family N-acetylglucosaminyl deacetylase